MSKLSNDETMEQIERQPVPREQQQSDIERCSRCDWPIVPEGEAGCWKSNCSMRPIPPERQPVPDESGMRGEGWQPIETAPRDENGGAILMAAASGHYAVCVWYEPVEKWPFCQTGRQLVFFDGATHWMPLPPAPAKTAA